MKKTLKLKKIGTASVAVTAGVALMLSAGAAVIRPSTAFADVTAPTQEADTPVFEKISLDDKCEYGQTFNVPAVDGTKVTVTAPNGSVAIDSTSDTAVDDSYSVEADQVGNYTVKYEKDGASYEFSVLVTLDEEYFLWVDANGADIPTYARVGGEIRLPVAAVKYYDENNILKDYPGAAPEIKVYASQNPDKVYVPDTVDDAHPATDDNTIKDLKAGKLYVTYSAKIGGADGLKYFTREFVVNVQSKVDDSTAPTLSVAGVSNDISVNRAVTLPAATATDNFDENVKITVKVTDPNGDPVKMTEVDKYGYAYRKADTEYADVVFDNDKAMTFYPMLPAGMNEGTFVVTYSAVDDAGNASSERQYYMTAKDLAAPVFQNESDYNWMIPETWGMTVKKAGATKGETVVADGKGGKITFPVLDVVDNRDHAYPTSEDDNNLITLYFRISDADNSNKTIVEFSNILDASESGAGRKFTANGTYTENAEFDKDNGFTFDFGKYARENKTDGNVDYSGTYTVYYRARDKAQNTSSKTFTVTMQSEYTDSAAPSTAEVTAPDYISAKDGETMIVPSPAVADAADSRPHTVYRIYSDNGLADEDGKLYITVKGGEEAKFVADGAKRYLVIDEGTDYTGAKLEKKLELGSTLYFFVSAEDKVGNVKYNTTDNTDDYTKSEAVTKIVSEDSGVFEYNGEVKFGAEVEDNGQTVLSDKIKEGDKVNAGGFNIVTDEDMRNYTGFEVAVRNEKGDPVAISLDTFSKVESGRATIYVKNIKFDAPTAGDYTMTVRVFDVNGVSSVYGYAFTIDKNENVGPGTSAAVISEKGDVNVKYQLHNETIPGVGEAGHTYHVARQIEGKVFGVMGNEFTAKTVGTFYFRDGYIDTTDIADYKDFNTDVTPYGKDYYLVATDSAAPVLEIQGVMPRYQEKSTAETKHKVELPSVTAYTANGTATVEVTVKNKAGNDVKVEDGDNNSKYFYGETDGEHTVTYTATYRSATPVTKTFTVYIGDVIGPDFNVVGGTSGRLTKGDEFKFGKIELVAGEGGTVESGVTITKRLIDPSGADVSGATVSGSYASYANSENSGSKITLDMSGRYQVVYTATDSVGNVTTYPTIEITVVSDGSSKPTTITTLSTVLIIIAVVLLAGVIVYVVRFRKVKEKK